MVAAENWPVLNEALDEAESETPSLPPEKHRLFRAKLNELNIVLDDYRCVHGDEGYEAGCYRMTATDLVNAREIIDDLRETLATGCTKPEAKVVLRPNLRKFAEAQEEVLKANDHKGGWDNMTAKQVYDLLEDEMNELADIVLNNPDLTPEEANEQIRHECCDVANYAMMLFAICK